MKKRSQMFSHVTRWKLSGLSQQAYCKKAGLVYPTFRYWFLKSKDNQQDAGFIPIAPDRSLSEKEYVEVRYPNGVELRLPPCCHSSLAELIKLY